MGAQPLVDGFGRTVRDLRISVTDRCNFRCFYCMPEEGMQWLPRQDLLSFEEIERIARICVERFGFEGIRLTGGEPTVRAHLPVLVDKLARLRVAGDQERPVDLAMTTNGATLPLLAGDLRRAGLRRINISCDSLRPERFLAMTRRDALGAVLEGIDAALDAGFDPVKVNVVLVRGVNDDELVDMATFGRERGVTVRFIEFMPLDAQGRWDRGRLVPGHEVYRVISSTWPLEPVIEGTGTAPAERFRFADGIGEIGIISSVTQPFCATCNRLRLTAEGAVRNCLFSDDERSVADILRSGGTEADLATLLRRAVWGKRPGHGINEPGFLRPARSMSTIGG
jgi:cyclic pyranopterin phosphate synthase